MLVECFMLSRFDVAWLSGYSAPGKFGERAELRERPGGCRWFCGGGEGFALEFRADLRYNHPRVFRGYLK